MRKLTYWLVGLLLIAVAVGAVLLLNNIREITWQAAENAVCQATVADEGGVDINSAFRFTFEDDVSANAVRRFLSVEPRVELNFHRGLQAHEVLAVPLEPLQPGLVYRFSLATERETLAWAFQTKREWLVESSNPALNDFGVHDHAPLEFYLNQSLKADISRMGEFFQISPHVEGRLEQEGNCLRFFADEPWAEGTVYTARLVAGLPAMGSDITLAEDFSLSFETLHGAGSVSAFLREQWRIAGMNLQFKPGQGPSFSCVLPGQPTMPPATTEFFTEFFTERTTENFTEKTTENFTEKTTENFAENSTENFTEKTTENFTEKNTEKNTENSEPQLPKISAALYRYEDAAAYAYDLLTWQQSAPAWSMGYIYAQGASTAGLTWLGNQDLTLELGPDKALSFSWPIALPAGYYLLQASYQGQSRDMRFQVSEIDAFAQADGEKILFWAHDSAEGFPLPEYTVSHVAGGNQTQADAGGLALMNLERHTEPTDIFLLQKGERSLVLAGQSQPLPVDAANMWQYLRLDKQAYQSGDKVDFWGYMRKHDGADWEWSRVTVYICPADAPEEPVAQDYAPLANNIFSGSIALPRLLPGRYELQIWQSGQQLLSKEFWVDTMVIGAADGPASINVDGEIRTLVGDKAAYGLNEGYTLSWPEAGESRGGYLFFKQGLQEAGVEHQALRQGVFTLEDAGGFWQAVSYGDGQYQVSAPLRLPLDNSAYSLNVQLENREKANREGGQTLIGITARDAVGAAPQKAGVLALIGPPGLDMGDILAEIYSSGSRGFSPEPFAAQKREMEDIPYFTGLELDKDGQAELAVALPKGSWRLYVWVVADAALPLAGQSAITLSSGEDDDMQPDKPEQSGENSPNEAVPLFWATRYDISAGSSHFIHKGLLYFSSQERVQAMELLWQPLFSKNETVEQSLGHAYARLLWQRYGYADFSVPLPAGDFVGLSEWQQPDGSIAAAQYDIDTLFTTMRTAALARDGLGDMFDTAALGRYLRAQAIGPVAGERRAMALAGLAALGKPVLQELKLMLALEGQTPLGRAALIWGLAMSGDKQVAKAAFHDFWGAFATDATSGRVYLEGGQGQNIQLNHMGALAAAACGEARISFALLQYLRAQQGYDDLSTALICGTLLSSLYASPANAALTYFLAPQAGENISKDGRAFEVEIGAFTDAWQEYVLPGNLLVDSAQGDIAMTCLRVE